VLHTTVRTANLTELCTKWCYIQYDRRQSWLWITHLSLHLPYSIGSCRQELRKPCNNLFTRCQAFLRVEGGHFQQLL